MVMEEQRAPPLAGEILELSSRFLRLPPRNRRGLSSVPTALSATSGVVHVRQAWPTNAWHVHNESVAPLIELMMNDKEIYLGPSFRVHVDSHFRLENANRPYAVSPVIPTGSVYFATAGIKF